VLHQSIDASITPVSLWKLTAKKCLLWKKFRDQVVCRQYLACVKNWRQELKCFERQVESNIIESNNLRKFCRYVNN